MWRCKVGENEEQCQQPGVAGLPTGVHKKCKAGAKTLERLYSCERVFCSQSLEEPDNETAAEPPGMSITCNSIHSCILLLYKISLAVFRLSSILLLGLQCVEARLILGICVHIGIT